MDLFDKNGWFDAEMIKPENNEKLWGICNWFNDRVNEIDDGEHNVELWNESIVISWSWDDYCRGCFMGREHESVTISNEIFFSNYSLHTWQKEEKERHRIEQEEKNRKEAATKKRANTRARNLTVKKKEEKDMEEYKRLKQKFEGDES